MTQNTSFLQYRMQHSHFCQLVDQVSHSVVSRNSITRFLAADSVVAQHIHGLHAKRTRNIIRVNREAEESADGGEEDFRRENGIFAIQSGRLSSNPGVRVLAIEAFQTLLIPLIGVFYQ